MEIVDFDTSSQPKSPQDLANAARTAGSDIENSRSPAVLAALKKFKINEEKVISELATIAFSDLKNYVRINEGGALEAIPLDQISPRKATRAIKKIKETTKITESDDGSKIWKESKVEYELYDKLSALKTFVEILDMLPSDKKEIEHSGKVIIVEDPFAKFR